MSDDKTLHSEYCEKLRKIGEKLDYETTWKNSSEKELYHLANPDCIWYQNTPEKLKSIKDMPEKIPLIVFEVLYSEKEKNMRGSLASFLLRDAYRGVFVILKPERESEKKSEKRIMYLKKIISKLSSNRFIIWEASDVDNLLIELGIQ
jgi:hypothetical protein